MPSAPVIASAGRILGESGVDHTLTFTPSRSVRAGSCGGELGAPLLAHRHRCSKPDSNARLGRMMMLPLSPSTRIGSPSSPLWRMSWRRPIPGTRMAGRRIVMCEVSEPSLEQHAFNRRRSYRGSLGGAEVARDQHRVVGRPSAPPCPSGRRRSAAAGSTNPRGRASAPCSSGSSISCIPRAGALLDALDRGFAVSRCRSPR